MTNIYAETDWETKAKAFGAQRSAQVKGKDCTSLARRSRSDELLADSVTGFAYVALSQMTAVANPSVTAERHITSDATERP